MMREDNKQLIQAAQAAIKQGQKSQARRLLQQVLQQDPQNYVGWLLLASVTPNPHTTLEYILRAEKLNPTSATVQKAKQWAQAQLPPEADDGAETAVTPFWQRPALRWGALAAAVLLILALLSLSLWNQFTPQEDAIAASVAADTVIVTTGTPAPAESGELQVIAASVSGTGEEINSEEPVSSAETAVIHAASATPVPPAIHPKRINAQASAPRPTWTLTPVPTPTPLPTNTPMPTFTAPQNSGNGRPFGVGPNERWVDVNLTTQTLVAYEGDTVALSTAISSGTWQHPTVTGQFRIYIAFTSQTMDGRRLGYDYYLENVPYVMYFYEDYALHGTFWHNNFGTPMSHGCVNMRTSDAEWLYNWVSIGTLVNVHY
ncbi:MAG: L,D-transpeptidase family protein [Ardenticatenaceae bacterium]|nr:L,D-transpeptidase family protein [Anaerolineales bacterium]MCB8921998.1 L,D-transpeptidase family protein [Ardenticatenaceae bacterium]MCB8989574.1 L,D-transpeptidase family protein [Ardenticatenaceae bacterium]MCB9003117.1 L,D-transpeptidase family protein [Ardenticatenaceae bacterium]